MLFGAGVAAGTVGLILVSFAGTEVTVPALVGLTVEEAEFQAGRSNLRFEVEAERYDLRMTAGKIISQKPVQGITTRRGRVLTVVVSKGIDSIRMPDFTGERMDQAQLKAGQSKLKIVGVSYVHHSSEAHTVVTQTPPPGEVVPKESETTLLISLGPEAERYVMPPLAGLSLPDARKAMERYGIQMGAARIIRDPSLPFDTIVSQNPPAGTPLEPQDVIQVAVSRP